MSAAPAIRTAFCATLAIATAAMAAADSVPERPTFSAHVAPILYQHCATCHRPGDIAPMSLITYDEARPWAKSIAKAVSDRNMPPWHADPGIGHFANDRSLSQAEIDTILNWVEAGAPRGNPSDAPPQPQFPDSGWRLGEPDLIVEFQKVDLPAGGPDQFHDLVAETGLTEDRWVNAIEVQPGNRKVNHHVIVWQGGEGGDRGWLGAWAAGMPPMQWPKGMGRLVSAGQPLVADMHYHPADTPESDQTRIGLFFADESEIEKEVINLWIQNATFEIPAGAENYGAKATHTFDQDVYLISLLPHMHYRGKDFTYTARFPDGRREKLLRVGNYDFNWQTTYEFAEPLFVPKGTRIECVAHWDNSANNPANPDPTRNVRFGNESYDEMMIGFVDYIVKDGIRPLAGDEAALQKARELATQHPGDIYLADVNQPDGQTFKGVLQMPRDDTKGVWFLSIMGAMREAAVTNIKWEGQAFAATINVIGQFFEIDGVIQPSGELKGFIRDAENDDPSIEVTITGRKFD